LDKRYGLESYGFSSLSARDVVLAHLRNRDQIEKWLPETQSTALLLDAAEFNCASIHGTKGNPCLVAAILDDWREGVFPTAQG